MNSTTSTDLDALIAAIAESPGDTLPLLITADYLDEQAGKARTREDEVRYARMACGLRWAAENGKYPSPRAGGLIGRWYWVSGPNHSKLSPDLSQAISHVVWDSDGLDLSECWRLFLDHVALLDWSSGQPRRVE